MGGTTRRPQRVLREPDWKGWGRQEEQGDNGVRGLETVKYGIHLYSKLETLRYADNNFL